MRNRLSRVAWAAVAGTVLACAFGAYALNDSLRGRKEGAAPPIRVVRFATGDLDGLRNGFQLAYDACRADKGLEPGAAPMPATSALGAMRLVEEEELFDGPMWAKYVVNRRLDADATHGCNPVVVSTRSVIIAHTCKWEVRATSGALVSAEAGSAGATPTVTQEDLSDSCDGAIVDAPDTRDLPQESAGPASCIWSSALLARTMGAATTPAGPSDAGFDTCLYARRPGYVQGGQERPVILKTRSPSHVLQTQIGELAAVSLDAEVLSDGAPIPAERFSRTAAEEFVRRPAREPLGVVR